MTDLVIINSYVRVPSLGWWRFCHPTSAETVANRREIQTGFGIGRN
ncbi:hypothetical protein [Chamaesiphon minutus]|nr:hypothetical protein [Chamaesiphon minutus]